MSLVDIAAHTEIYASRMCTIADLKASLLAMAPRNALVLDYGCWTGDVIAAAARIRPDLHFVGYDYLDSAIVKAQARDLPNTVFTADERAAFAMAHVHDGPKVLFLSSVMHEVVSVHGDAGFAVVLDQAHGFDQVVLRDMASDVGADRIADAPPAELLENGTASAFAARWGRPDTAVRVAHLMLKARYADNWDAEMRENYLPYDAVRLLDILRARWPEVRHFEHSLPPFFVEEFTRDYGRVPLTRTHIEIICAR